MNFYSQPSSCTKSTMLHQPSTSSQPIPNLDLQETFGSFTLNGADASPTTPTRFNSELPMFDIDNDEEEGYSTPTGEIAFVPEDSWIYSTPTKARDEPVCPGAPKRKTNKDPFSSTISFSQSLPSETISPKRGITKQKKYRKSSPSPFVRRSSFPNIRLDFSDIDVSDEGQNTN